MPGSRAQKTWNSETFLFRGSSEGPNSVNIPINHSLEEKPTGRIVRVKEMEGKRMEENILQTFSPGSSVVLKLWSQTRAFHLNSFKTLFWQKLSQSFLFFITKDLAKLRLTRLGNQGSVCLLACSSRKIEVKNLITKIVSSKVPRETLRLSLDPSEYLESKHFTASYLVSGWCQMKMEQRANLYVITSP